MQPGDTIAADHHASPTSARRRERAGAGGPGRLHHQELHRRQLDRRAVHAHQQHPRRLAVPPGGTIAAFSQTLNPPNNTFTFTGPAVTLPTSPAKYYLGVVVDPYGQIKQLSLPKNAAGADPGRRPARPEPAAGRGRVDGQRATRSRFPASGVFIGINPTTTTTSSGTGRSQHDHLIRRGRAGASAGAGSDRTDAALPTAPPSSCLDPGAGSLLQSTARRAPVPPAVSPGHDAGSGSTRLKRRMSRRYVNQLTHGDSIDEVFLVADKQLRANRQGNLYLQLELRDKTGSIGARLWNATEELSRVVRAGRLPADPGQDPGLPGVAPDHPDAHRRGRPGSRVEPEEFLPQSSQNVGKLMARLREVLLAMGNPHLRALVECFLIDDEFVRKFTLAPAGIKNHHAYQGGLRRARRHAAQRGRPDHRPSTPRSTATCS